MKKFFYYFLFAVVILCVITASATTYYAWRWMNTPVTLSTAVHDFKVNKGDNLKTIIRTLDQQGIKINPFLFEMYTRFKGLDTQVKAGAYEIKRGDTPVHLLDKIASGDMSSRRITLVEGLTFKQYLQTIESHPDIRQTLKNKSIDEILNELGTTYKHPEGLFFPDTYVFVPGDSDFDILRRAYNEANTRLQQVWDSHDPSIPLKTPYELLIMASIIEKETSHSEDRDVVAGVFMNRLKAGMRLQTDPTVIYGMGEKYQGRIYKKDLTTDTPWNTYTRKGLPPTPIANPGIASLLAASHPANHDYYYFVSKGDGSSAFSKDLTEHNKNVNKFILKKN